jgi:hypothetical protein
MDINKLNTERGEIIGIGKFKLKKTALLKQKIPMLSFILIEESKDSYIAVCIHLRTDGYGKTKDLAILDMIDNARFFMEENFNNPKCKEKAWENLEDLFKCDDWTSELWNSYHAAQIVLSQQGRSTDTFETLEHNIKLLKQRVERLESKEAKELMDKITNMKKTMDFGYNLIKEEKAA